MICCIIPAYKATQSVCEVVSRTIEFCDRVLVVDDRCPEGSGRLVAEHFASDSRVEVLFREKNGGVGAALKTGIERALAAGADFIIKIDADGQMDPAFIRNIVDVLESDTTIAYAKGNRFSNADVLSRMPKIRLFGNAVLSLLVKLSSGYWNLLDPTNGYIGFNARFLRAIPWSRFANRYFLEISVLCEFGLKRLRIAEIAMPTIYGEETSSLSIRRVMLEFPPRLTHYFFRRITAQYFGHDTNIGTVYLALGLLCGLFSLIYGSYEWYVSAASHTFRSTGTVMLAAAPMLVGLQLWLNALMYDVQCSSLTLREVGHFSKAAVRSVRRYTLQ